MQLIAVILVTAIGIGRGEAADQPTMTSSGAVEYGSRSIKLRDGYGAAVFTLDYDVQGSMGEVFEFPGGYTSPPFFLDPADEISGNTAGFKANVRENLKTDENLGTYEFSLTLQPDGLVRVASAMELTRPELLKTRFLSIDLPQYIKFRGTLEKDGDVKEFDGLSQVTYSGNELNGATVTLFPGDPRMEFALHPESCSELMVNGNKLILYAADDGKLSYLVDLKERIEGGKAAEVLPNGIDVWTPDLLGTPDFSTSRNLILNPSFEMGFKYWSFRIFSDNAQPLKYDENYVIDDTVAHTGSNSLRLRAMTNPLPFSTFALPVTPDETYTFSFWAKGSEGKTLGLKLDARSGNSSPIEGMPSEEFVITDEWQRFETSFSVQNEFVAVFIRPTGVPNMDSFIWVDDVQFEKGKMTDFDEVPIQTKLVSSARGNFLEFGQQPDLKLQITAPPKSQGSVSVFVEDFFFETLFEGEFAFTTDESGRIEIPLVGLDQIVVDQKLRGVFQVTTVVKIDGETEPLKDYARFSVMDFLKNEHRNKHIFDLTYAYTLQAGGPETERFFEHERNLGYGSYSYDFMKFGNDLDLAMDKERADLLEEYGFQPTGRLLASALTGNGEISELNGEMTVTGIKDMIDPTPEQLAAIEEICRVKAELRPWGPIWFFTAESDPGMMPMAGDIESFAKLIVAATKGIKKGNPNAKMLVEGGPWNIDPENGIALYEKYIQETKKVDPNVKFDGAAGHHYINFPEELDPNVEAFLEMLDRNGHPDWPLYLNEGGAFTTMSFPQLGITPYVWNSANRWYIPSVSYGIGRAERISAAFMARAWLVALKYQDRVACMNSFFTPSRYLDVDFTPRVNDKIPNTLGRLFGDAAFYQDVKFAPYSRAYVFLQDADKAPIAALWGYKETVDRFKEEPSTIQFDFRNLDLTFIDLMENEVTFPTDADGNTLIPMTPFPIFIKGAPGTEEALAAAIADGFAVDGSLSDAVQVAAYPTGDGTATLVLKNNLPRSFDSEATITLNGVAAEQAINLSALEETTMSLAIPGAPLNTDKILGFDFALTLEGGEPFNIVGGYVLLNNNASKTIEIDGNFDDWKDVPAINLGDGVTLRTFVEKGYLSFAIEKKGGAESAAKAFDGVGFYFDPFERTFNWTTPKNAKGDLGIYELQVDESGNLRMYCHIVQGTQAGSSSKILIHADFQPLFEVSDGETADGQFVECRIPEILLSPLRLTPGCRFGLNISIPTTAGLKSLAPIPNYQSPGDLGDLELLMAIFAAPGDNQTDEVSAD